VRNIIRELRSERGWTQADLAARLEVSRQTVNSLEKGRYDPSLPLAFRVARVLEKTIEEIFTDE
jgi:putative transcriptional regulator